MDFSWIKRLFKIKSTTNVSDVGISTIDTSFIKVPRLSDLSKENQDKVMEYFNEIKYDNYETIVKYSDSLLERSNREIDFFVHDLEDSIKDISSIIKEVSKNNHFKLLLYKEEIKLSIDEITKIEEEAELRLIALDMYIKKEEKRKYDFLGIFGKAERLRYLSDKSSLLNERQRLLVTIKLIRQHLQIIYNTLKNNKELLEQMELYFTNSSSFNTMYCDSKMVMMYAQELLDLKRLIDKNNCDELEQLEKNSATYHKMILTRKLANISIDEFDKIQEILEYQKVIHLLAKEKRKIKQYAYEHRNDYKNIISEINTLVSKYEQEFRTNHFSEWNIEEIKQNTIKYANSIELLTRICGRYLNSDNYDELIKKMTNLALYLLIGDNFNFNGYLNVYYGNDVVSYAEKASSVHFDKCIKLLDEVLAKYGINESIFDEIEEDDDKKKTTINRLVLQLINNNEVKYLYDLLRDGFDIYKITYQDELLFVDDWAKRILIYPLLSINGHILRGFRNNKAKQELLDSITINKQYDYDDFVKFYRCVSLWKIAKILKFIGINKFDEKLLINNLSQYIMLNQNIQTNNLLRIIYAKIFIDRIIKEEKEESILTIPSIIKLSKDYNTPFNKSIIYLEDSDDLDNLNIIRDKKTFGYRQKNPTFENLKVVFINYTLAKKFLGNKDYEIVNSEHEVVAQNFSKKKKNIIDVKSWEILNKKNTDFYQIYCYDSYSFGEEFRLYAVPDNTKVQDIQEYIINNSKKTVNEKLLSKMI